MGARAVDVALMCLVVWLTACTAMQVDLASLLRNKQRQQQAAHIAPAEAKRGNGYYYDYDTVENILDHSHGGPVKNNPCPDPEKPFPCGTVDQCIPLKWLCDDNEDCTDGYDENEDLCTAKHRPPIEDIMYFLDNEQDWIIPSLFGGKPPAKVAHALVVSKNIDDFRRRMGLSKGDGKKLRAALEAAAAGDEETLVKMGMPQAAMNEVSFIFGQLLKSNFISNSYL